MWGEVVRVYSSLSRISPKAMSVHKKINAEKRISDRPATILFFAFNTAAAIKTRKTVRTTEIGRWTSAFSPE